jgi:hypothetical protein
MFGNLIEVGVKAEFLFITITAFSKHLLYSQQRTSPLINYNFFISVSCPSSFPLSVRSNDAKYMIFLPAKLIEIIAALSSR